MESFSPHFFLRICPFNKQYKVYYRITSYTPSHLHMNNGSCNILFLEDQVRSRSEFQYLDCCYGYLKRMLFSWVRKTFSHLFTFQMVKSIFVIMPLIMSQISVSLLVGTAFQALRCYEICTLSQLTMLMAKMLIGY